MLSQPDKFNSSPVTLLGQLVCRGSCIMSGDREQGELISNHLIAKADFMTLRNRILAQRREAWIGEVVELNQS